MSIGAGIALIVIGAILAFAINVDTGWVDLDLIGYILMGAGVVVVLIGIVLLARGRRTNSVTRETIDPESGQRVVRRSSSSSDDVT